METGQAEAAMPELETEAFRAGNWEALVVMEKGAEAGEAAEVTLAEARAAVWEAVMVAVMEAEETVL